MKDKIRKARLTLRELHDKTIKEYHEIYLKMDKQLETVEEVNEEE